MRFHTEFSQSMAKSKNCITIAFLFIGILVSLESSSQGLFSKKNVINQYTTVGIGGGSSHYYGELSRLRYPLYGLYTNVRWNINANYTRYLTPNAAARLQLSWIRILGDDFIFAQRNLELMYQNLIRNLHFRNDIKEVTLSGIFNLIPAYNGGARDRLKFTPYLTVGLGLAAHSPEGEVPIGLPDAGTWTPLRDKRTAGQDTPASTLKAYSLVTPVVPLGLGLRFKVNNKIDITFEGNVRLTNSDYLDDIGNDPYPNQAQLRSYIGEDVAYSYRAEEIFSRTDVNRIPLLIQAFSNIPGYSGSFDPAQIPQYYGPEAQYGTMRGNTPRKDIYATTQVTISYIISDKIKCPVLK